METVNSFQSATTAHALRLLLLLYSFCFVFFILFFVFCPCHPTTSSHWLLGAKAAGLLTLPSSPRTARNQTCLSVHLSLSLFLPPSLSLSLILQLVSLSWHYQQLEALWCYWNAPPDGRSIIDSAQLSEHALLCRTAPGSILPIRVDLD